MALSRPLCKYIQDYATLQKIPQFHLISWCENFVEGSNSCTGPKTMRKLCLSAKFSTPKYQVKLRYFSQYYLLRSKISKLIFSFKKYSIEYIYPVSNLRRMLLPSEMHIQNFKRKFFFLQIFSKFELPRNLIKMTYLKEHSATKTSIYSY